MAGAGMRSAPHILIPPDSNGAGSGPSSITSQDHETPYRSPELAMPGRQRQKEVKKHSLYISSAGQFRTFIDFTSLFAVIFCTVMVPYDMAFEPPRGLAIRAVDVGIESFFILELFLNFFTSYFDDTGEEITQHSKMAINYLKGWFIIDISSSVPGETATIVAEALIAASVDGGGDTSSMESLKNLKTLRILRLTKLLRLAKLGQILESMEFNYPALAVVIGLFRLGFTMMLVSHLNACIFYWVGTLNIGNSWISKYTQGCCDMSVALFAAEYYGANGTECFDPSLMPTEDTLYVDAVYWSLTTLATVRLRVIRIPTILKKSEPSVHRSRCTKLMIWAPHWQVGYGEITPCNEMEQLYTMTAMVIGSGMFAYIVGSISTVAMQSNGQEIQMRQKVLQLQEYLELRQIPGDMAQRVRRQCIHKWKNTVFDEEGLLKEFNPKMKRKIVDFIKGDVVSKVPLIAMR